ncbi:MAG: Fic family protein [archaeon]|nr:Fic family protein [archaeon]
MNEIHEVKNAKAAYEMFDSLDPLNHKDLLRVHEVMMARLGVANGTCRTKGEGVFDGSGNCIHMAPPAHLVPGQIADLFNWMSVTDYPPLISSCIFHYEFEFIHPFEDGNGRMGRYWHKLILSRWDEVFRWVPIESIIHARQNEYYEAIAKSTEDGESSRFVQLMLEMILEALTEFREVASFSDESGRELPPSENVVYESIEKGEFITISKAARSLYLSTATITRALRSLKDRGLIKRIGSDKKGYWVIVRK